MTEKIKIIISNNQTSFSSAEVKKIEPKLSELTKIQGRLTSQVRQRQESKDPYFYAFIKLKGQGADLPVIFRIKDESFKPQLEKGNLVELTGYYSNSDKNIRKSFTCLTYQLLDKKIKKECSGCGDKFLCLNSENYDYCKNCSLNNNRYLNKQNNCSECDGSRIIKFPQQPLRNCKLCSLTAQFQTSNNQTILVSHE